MLNGGHVTRMAVSAPDPPVALPNPPWDASSMHCAHYALAAMPWIARFATFFKPAREDSPSSFPLRRLADFWVDFQGAAAQSDMSRPASSVKLFVGQIGRNADDAELRALLEPFGGVLEVSVIKDKATGQSKGAYVPYRDCFHMCLRDGGCFPNGAGV
jgi:hypothetical protein